MKNHFFIVVDVNIMVIRIISSKIIQIQNINW